MSTFQVGDWADVVTASGVAAAALLGLVLVAFGTHLDGLVPRRRAMGRAVLTLAHLACVLVVALLLLVPGQTDRALGLEVVGVAALLALVSVVWAGRLDVPEPEDGLLRVPLTVVLASLAPFLVGGTTLVTDSRAGLGWVVAGLVLGLLAGVLNAWLLLVESARTRTGGDLRRH